MYLHPDEYAILKDLAKQTRRRNHDVLQWFQVINQETGLNYLEIQRHLEECFGTLTNGEIYYLLKHMREEASRCFSHFKKPPYTHREIIEKTARSLGVDQRQVWIDPETGELIVYPLDHRGNVVLAHPEYYSTPEQQVTRPRPVKEDLEKLFAELRGRHDPKKR